MQWFIIGYGSHISFGLGFCLEETACFGVKSLELLDR